MLNEQLNNKLSMFGSLHLTTLAVFILVIFVFYFNREKIKNEKFEKIFRITMGVFLLTFESLYHIWVLSRSAYTIDMIPLTGFCALTNLLTAITLLSGKTKFFNYLIYYALTGALFSLVFVDTTYGIPHFRYFHYFFVHFGFLLSSLYYFFINKIEINLKNMIKASSVLFVYTIVVLIFDIVLNKNWFYLIESPVKEISDAFGTPWYTILWILTIIIITCLWYLLFDFLKRKKINI